MKLSTKIIFILFAAFIIGIFLWAVYSPKDKLSYRISKTLKEQEKKADLAFKEVTFEEVVAGIKYWQLQAKTAAINNSTQIATLKETHGTFFKNGRPVLRFRSPVALWDMKEKEILLDQPIGYDVKLESKISALLRKLETFPSSVFNLPELSQKNPGYWFQAKNLSWRLADEKLLCTGGIVLNKGEMTGFAQQLESDVGMENVTLSGQPRFIINPKDSSLITLEANTLKVISASDELLAQGNPRITWQTAKIFATNMTYSQRDKTLHLKDRVRVNYNDIQAIGNYATYYTLEEKIVLAGRAQASQAGNSLSGDEVMVSLKDKRIAVIGKGKVIINEEEIK